MPTETTADQHKLIQIFHLNRHAPPVMHSARQLRKPPPEQGNAQPGAGMLAYSKVACSLTFPWMTSLSVVAWA